MAGRKEFEMLFQLDAQLGSNYSGTFKNATQTMAKMQKEMQAVNKTQGNISNFEKQQKALQKQQQTLQKVQAEYKQLVRQEELLKNSYSKSTSEIGEGPKETAKALLDNEKQFWKTSAAVEDQEQKLQQMAQALQEAGVDTSQLASESERLEREYKELKQAQEQVAESAEEFGNNTQDAAAAMQELLAAAGVIALLKKMGGAMRECVGASIEYESAITGVYKTIDGTDQQLKDISDAIKEMSLVIPESTTNIAEVAEAAGQLGIATEDVMFFTEVMTNLGVATNMTAQDAATMLAKFSNITGMLAEDYGRLGSVITALGNTSATTESDIVNMATNIASAGKQVGLTESQIMAMAAALSSVGLEAQAGGTSISKLMINMKAAVETGSAALNDFSSIAGMTNLEFSHLFNTDATAAMTAFFVGLGEGSDSAIVKLEEMGVTETRLRDTLLRLTSAQDLFTGSLETAETAWSENTALQEEASKRYATTESQMQLCANASNLLKIAIGDVLTPVLGNLAGVGAEAFAWMAEFVDKNPQVVALITGAVAGVGALAAVLAAYTIKINIANLMTQTFGATLLATPVGQVAAALGLLVGAATAVGIATANAARETEDSYAAMTSATKDAQKALKEIHGEFQQTADRTVSAAGVASQYVDRLRELEAQGLQTDESQAEYKVTVERLNALMPELNLQIDAQTGLLKNNTDAVYENIEALKREALARAFQEEQSDILTQHAEVKKEIYSNQAKLNAAQSEENKLIQEANTLADEYKELQKQKNDLNINDLENQAKLDAEMRKNLDRQAQCNEEVGKLRNKQDDLTVAIGKSEKVLGNLDDELEVNAQAYNFAKNGAQAVAGAVDELTAAQSEAEAKASELAKTIQAAYEEAKVAARANIDSVVQGFTEMDNSAVTSAAKVQQALNSQITYLQNYSTNLQGLADRNVEGVDVLVQSLSDGSAESAAILAGLATATDEEIAGIVASMGQVEDGKNKLSEVMKALSPEVQAAMDAAIAEAQRYDEMYAAAADSGQGVVNGLLSKLGEVQAAGTALGNAFQRAYKAALDQHSPSRIMTADARDTVAGLMIGYEKAQPQLEATVHQVTQSVVHPFGTHAEMQRTMGQYAADAAQVITVSPVLMAAMQNRNAAQLSSVHTDAVRTADAGGVVVNFAPVYQFGSVSNATEVRSTLMQHDTKLKDYIIDVMHEAGIDAARRRFS